MKTTILALCLALFVCGAAGETNGQARTSSPVGSNAEASGQIIPPQDESRVEGESMKPTKNAASAPSPSDVPDVPVASLTNGIRANSFELRPVELRFLAPTVTASDEGSAELDAADAHANGKRDMSFRWKPALQQSLLFLGVQHGYALTQPKTRRDLKGPFLRDYFRSVKNLDKWDDGGRFFTNYIAHPLQGSFTGFIQVHNDPKGAGERFGSSPAYWRSRMKAMAWTAAWSTQFEIGPISQASIGNVGLNGKQTYVDIVMTPTAGTALLVAEDAMDKYVIERIERRTGNFFVKISSRMLLNPTRTCANLLRFKKPWYRDAGLR